MNQGRKRPGREERLARFAQAAADRGLYYKAGRLPYNPALTSFAQKLRANMTECETRIFEFLKTMDIKVRAQHPIDKYIVDFYIPKAHLVIEVDGEQHYTNEGKEYDDYRNEVLRLYYLNVLRIPNYAVRNTFYEVCKQIQESIASCQNQ
jgi:very-short-patch-repair endonuclease